MFLFFFVGNFGLFFFFQGTILSSTRPGEKPKLGGRYLVSGRAETQNRVGESVEDGFHSADRVRVRRNRVGDSLVSRTGSIRWAALGFEQRMQEIVLYAYRFFFTTLHLRLALV